jgi:hypothetical protein
MTGPSDVSTVNPRGPRGITQKEVEIDHLKTALYAVSNKLEVRGLVGNDSLFIGTQRS